MARRSARGAIWLLLFTMVLGWMPIAPTHLVTVSMANATGAGAPTTADDPPDPAVPVAPVPPEPFTPRPGLALAIAIAPDPLPIGATATISVTVANRAPYPAEHLVITAPTPDGAIALRGPVTSTPIAGWRWDVGHLDGASSAILTGTLQLVRAPAGDGLVATVQATADDLAAPATARGGALAIHPAHGPATSTFTPGTPATLRSQDGRVTVQLPANAAARALTLSHTANPSEGSHAPDLIGLRRSLGHFDLDATDGTGAAVHHFDAPLTLTVSYTPEQLQARGIRDADLALFWFDEAQQRWVPLPTEVDATTRTVRGQVDHFTTFALGDGTSASALYIPSLQGFQVSSFTGAASYRIPIETPDGPGGLKPSLDLSYSSAASDGSGGERDKWQAGWAGKGWSLGAEGFVARDRSLSGDPWNHFTLVFAGRSFDVVRGQLTNGCTDYYNTARLDCWTWHAVDENFVRVRAEPGGGDYIWKAWTPDGTRYDFTQALYDRPDPNSETVTIQAYKWLLKQAADPHGNLITYNYQVDPVQVGTNLYVHPTYRLTEILWGYDGATPGTRIARYRAEFVASAPSRWVSDAHGDTTGVDLQWEYPNAPNSYWQQATPHEAYRLNQIKIESKRDTSWQLVRQYNLFYASAADTTTPNVTTDSINGQAVLTLRSVQRVGNDGSTVLPATSFTYANRGTAQTPNPGGNRIQTIRNGQGGQVTFAYQNVWVAGVFPNEPSSLYENYHRVGQVTITNSAGPSTSALTTYAYDTPARNDYDHAATVVYAAYPPSGNGNSRPLLARPERREFRGHASVTERTYDGATTSAPLLREIQHSFYQGNGGTGTATCVPRLVTLGNGNQAVDETDACYRTMRDREAWKGREYQTEVRAAGGAVLQRTVHAFTREELPFYGSDFGTANASNNYRRAGLWRAFSAEGQTDAQTVEGVGTPVVKTTRTFYNTSCTADTAQTIAASYGNVGCTLEQDGAALVRKTLRWYGIRDEGATSGVWGRYLVDRVWQEAIYDASGYLLALTNQFYDTTTAADATPTIGELWRVARYYDIPPSTSSTLNLTLHGGDTTYAYDGYGNRTTETTYTGASTRLYNGTATTWGAVSGTARTTTTTYDSVFHALPVQETNAVGHVTTAAYDERMGTLIRVTGPNSSGGAITDCRQSSYSIPATEETRCAQYDGFGRLVALVKPGDSTSYPTVQATYYDGEQPFRYRVDQRETAGAAGVRVNQTFYDGLGRTIQAKQEGPDAWQNIVVDTRYDGMNRVSAQSQARYSSETSTSFWQYTAPGSPLYRATTTSYDALGRALVVTAPNGTTTQTSYGLDGDGPWTKTIDANGHATIVWTDVFGRRRLVREYRGTSNPRTLDSTTTYGYDALDHLTRVTDALGNVTTIGYDSLGRKTSMGDPDMGAWSYAYDPNGNLTRQTDANGQTIWFGYDNLNRVTAKRVGSATGSLLASYGYDAGTNGVGQRTTMSVPNGASTTWTYDARGRKTGAMHTLPGLNATRPFAWAYDSADRLTTLTYPSLGGVTEQVTYAYDAAGRPTQVCSNRTNQPCYVSGATYTALDQPDAWTLGNNVPVDWGYSSPMQRLAQLKIGAGTPASVFDRAYTYDAVGNVVTIANTRSGVTQTFAYDDRDQLTTWTEGAGSQSYRYDALGNLTSKAGVGYQYGANLNGTGAGPHQARSVGGQAYSYDANGNLLSDSGRTYAWDAENHPTSISSGGVTETYSYDADGERVTQTRGGTTTVYLEGLWEEVAGGVAQVSYPFNGQVIALRASAPDAVTYLHADHLGSMSVATNAGGAVIGTQEFDPWGQVRPGGGTISQTTRNYTGQRLDGTGLLFYHARYYDPALGRFVSADSLVPEVKNPQAWNRYSYVKNNPLRYTDPTGHCIWDACIVEGAAVVAIATTVVYAGFQVWNAMDPPGGKKAPQPAVWSSDTGGQPAEPTPPPYDPKDSKVKGDRAEALLSRHLGIGKNIRVFRVDIETETGTRSLRVQPNFVDFKRGFVAESQNSDHILFNQRIRAILQVAEKNGLRFDLYVRKDATTNSIELQRLIDSGQINLIRFFE